MNKINLTKNRVPLEGNFVLSLYKNPLEFYYDYPINPDKDLLTADGKFYYNLGKSMLDKGVKNFNEVSLTTFLNSYPDLKSEYEKRGAWKSIEEYMNILDNDNIDAYYNELVKNNLLIQLDKKGFNIEANINIFNQLKNSDEILDFLEAQLNSVALNLTKSLDLQTLDYTEKEIQQKLTGEQIGLQFDENCPLLNSFCNGIPRKGLTMFASYTNGGKTSFVFENIVLPLVKKRIKVCVISNEQDIIVFKDLLAIHVLTTELDYWNIDRTKIKTLNFNKEDTIFFEKARKIIKEKYKPYILFQRVYDYGMKNIKRTIKKLAKQKFELFIYDTFKVDNTLDSVWQSFLNDSKELFQVASKEGIAVITPVQIAASTKGKIRWLNESVLSNSKQIAEIYEEIFMFRDIWRDEYSCESQDIHTHSYEKDENDNYTNIEKEIPLQFEMGKHYKIFFHCKSRNGEVGRTVVYRFLPYTNKWKELGYCTVGEDNKL